MMSTDSTSRSNEGVYVIKGIALDTYKYGRKIKFLEDLKGNFPENVDTLIVWGGWSNNYPYFTTARPDFLDGNDYDNHDVLIMLLQPSTTWSLYAHSEIPWLEKYGDFSTIGCTFCVLKLSDGHVMGRHIFQEEGFYNLSKKFVSWNEFNEILKEVLKQ